MLAQTLARARVMILILAVMRRAVGVILAVAVMPALHGGSFPRHAERRRAQTRGRSHSSQHTADLIVPLLSLPGSVLDVATGGRRQDDIAWCKILSSPRKRRAAAGTTFRAREERDGCCEAAPRGDGGVVCVRYTDRE